MAILAVLSPARTIHGRGIVYDMVELTRGFEGCDPEKEVGACTFITYRFPVILEGPNETVEEALREDIRGFLYGQGNYTGEDFYEIKEKLFRDYGMFRVQFPDSALPWFIEKDIRVIHRTERILTFYKRSDSFFGGPHPLPLVYFASLDLNTGKVLRLRDLILSGAIPRLTDFAERQFREMKGVGSKESLEERFLFPGGRFRLSDNMAVTEKGLLFYYNVYEIEGYAAGPTELLIPYTELRGITTPVLSFP